MRVSRRHDTDPGSVSDDDSMDEPLTSEDAARDLFQQYFESRFEALKQLPPPSKDPESDDEAPVEDVGEWQGIVDDEGLEKLVIVDHGNIAIQNAEPSLASKRSFINSRPPSLAGKPTTSKERNAAPGDEEGTKSEVANLKQDIALQKLLRESSLLDTQSSLTPMGKHRHKALDIQFQNLGSKSSIYAQERMPLSQKRGIQTKAMMKEKERRQSAIENGIILEKAISGSKRVLARRTRAVGTPSVGRFQGGMLKLSKKDLADITGPKPTLKRRR